MKCTCTHRSGQNGAPSELVKTNPRCPVHIMPKPDKPTGYDPDDYRNAQAEEGITALLSALGEEPARVGLQDTPRRFVRAMLEMTCGLREDPKEHLRKVFPLDDTESKTGYDEVILSGGLDFVSICEHHLLPFSGIAHIGYLPRLADGSSVSVVGLSKLARMLDGYAKRPQVQERLTQQVALAIEEVLQPRGVAVVIKAQHSCQCMRGVRKQGHMTTSAMLGCFRSEPAARMEFLELIKL